jgi:hypothetical protein
MTTLITSVLLQILVVGGLMVWGFRKDRVLRRRFPERYEVKEETRGYR